MSTSSLARSLDSLSTQMAEMTAPFAHEFSAAVVSMADAAMSDTKPPVPYGLVVAAAAAAIAKALTHEILAAVMTAAEHVAQNNTDADIEDVIVSLLDVVGPSGAITRKSDGQKRAYSMKFDLSRPLTEN